MFTVIDKVGFVCMSIVGFYLLRIFFRVLYNYVIGPRLGLNANLKQMGDWAVVTGATDGLGRGYADALAAKGINIILVSRNQGKLKDVASQIEKQFGVQTKVIVADFTKGREIYNDIEKQLEGLEIGVLVNNVGISYPYPEYFLELGNENDIYSDIIHCNIMSVTHMCKIVMPGMVHRHKGVVVNVSSVLGHIPCPLIAIYGASKAYIHKFSDDISTEYSKSGIIVQCISPGYIATKMSKIRNSTWMIPTPKDYVQSALNTIGIQDHTAGYFPHILHGVIVNMMDAVSPKLFKWYTMRSFGIIREKALERKARRKIQ